MSGATPESLRSFVDGRRQLGLIGGLALVYFAIRTAAADQRTAAFENAANVVNLEHRLGVGVESILHDAVMASEPLIRLFNWVYLWGHFPVLITALVVLWAQRHADYARLRNALIVSGAIGLVIFAVYPVAPPRLFAPDTFFDSVHELSASHRVLQNPRFTNQYAAVPSFHVGWNLLVAIALARATTRRHLRLLAATMPVAMCVAVVATANHWLLDIAVGAVVALTGWFAAGWIAQRRTKAEAEDVIDLRDPDIPEPETAHSSDISANR